mgnify:CR=1 FL=1
MQLRKALPTEFYNRDVVNVARELPGKLLCRRSRSGFTVGRIVETEAYLAEGDSASHSFSGINRKNASMLGPPGRAYVYTIHARQCVNVVTEEQGRASAVLIRAVEPLLGIPHMQRRRRTEKLRDLCRGPARLCEAFDIRRDLDGWNLSTGKRLWIADHICALGAKVCVSARIGVTSATEAKLRFYEAHNSFVSGPAAAREG